MENKRISNIFTILVLVMCSLVLIGAVSAEDSSESQGNFTNLNDTIDVNSEIDLVGDIQLNNGSSNEETTFKDGINITKVVTIDGHGFTINATDSSNQVRVFNVSSNGNLTLKNMIITGGYADRGGAIYNEGILNLVNVTFINNDAKLRGGAIYNNEGDLTIADSIFNGNNITGISTSGANNYGGAAIFSTGNLNVSSSEFTNNLPVEDIADNNCVFVGAIATVNGATSIKDSYFKNNSGRYGGAIYAEKSNLNVTNSNFVENNGMYGAGVNIQEDSTFNIVDSNFTSNAAEGKGDMSPNNNNGGAIAIMASAGVINNCDFVNNSAHYAGAIDIDAKFVINITNSRFENNSATAGGGAIDNSAVTQYDGNMLNIINTTFIANNNSYGGAIRNVFNMNIVDCSFIANNATYGGAIYNFADIYGNTGNVAITKSIFVNNTVDGEGTNIFNMNNNDGMLNITYSILNSKNSIHSTSGSVISAEYNWWGHNDTTKEVSPKDLGYTNFDVVNWLVLNTTTINPNLNIGESSNVTITLTSKNTEFDRTKLPIIPVTITTNAGDSNVSTINLIDGVAKVTYTATSQSNEGYLTADIYGNSSTVSFKNSKINSTINGTVNDIVYGEDATVYVSVAPSTVTGNVTFTIDGMDYTIELNSSGEGSCVVSGLNPGEYNVTLSYDGDECFNGSSAVISFNVIKASSVLNGTVNDIVYGEDATVYVSVAPSTVTGNVTFTIDGMDYTIELNGSGEGSCVVSGLNPGEYNVTLSYDGDECFNGSSALISFNVSKSNSTIIAGDVVKYFKNGTQYTLTLVNSVNESIVGENIIITIKGKNYTRTTDENGSATLNINLIPGEYNISAIYNGSDVYEASIKNNTINVLAMPTVLTVNNLTKTFGDDSKLNVTLTDIDNNPIADVEVVITVNGVNYYRTTDSDGVAYLKFNLGEGTYTISSLFTGSNYLSSTSNGIVTVNAKGESRNPTIILTEDINMTYKDGSKYTFTLKDSEGNNLANKTVILNVNGKEYTRTTDENGSGSLSINLVSGIYSITTKFLGDEDYSASSITSSVYIHNTNDTKILTKINVKSNKVVSGSQFAITLTDVNNSVLAGQTLTFTVNGKAYNRVTDNDGIAKLNINLSPGTYKISTAYTGDNDYSSAATVNTNMEVSKLLKM